jgi:hypothetical protein
MDAIGVLLLFVGALAIGIVGQKSRLLPRASGWVIGTVAAAIGGLAGSELFGARGSWGPDIGGLLILPALIAGTIFAGVIDLLTRLLTPGPLGWRSQELLTTPAPEPTGPGSRRRRRRGPAACRLAGGDRRNVPATARRG